MPLRFVLPHLCPLLRCETLWCLDRHHSGAGPLNVAAVVSVGAIIEKEHFVVGDAGVLVQLSEVSALVVWVDLSVRQKLVDHDPRLHLDRKPGEEGKGAQEAEGTAATNQVGEDIE